MNNKQLHHFAGLVMKTIFKEKVYDQKNKKAPLFSGAL